MVNMRNTISLLLALLITTAFLWAVLTPPSIFNILPFAIHEAFDPGGSSESTFINVFNICFAIVLFAIVYLLAKSGFKTYGIFR